MDTFLPVATRQGDAAEAFAAARRMSALAVYAVVLFFAAPLAVAPVFLYAWVGEMGYVSRHVFAYLALGATANLLVMPVAALAQAANRPEVQARAAIASIVLNVPLSLLLVRVWGVEGAALGSTLAMVLGTAVLIRAARQALGASVVGAVMTTLGRHWPLGVVCLVWGVAVHYGFGRWFEGTTGALRYGMRSRAVAGGCALLLYLACVTSLAAMKVRLGGLELEDKRLLARLAATVGIRRLADVPTTPDP